MLLLSVYSAEQYERQRAKPIQNKPPFLPHTPKNSPQNVSLKGLSHKIELSKPLNG